MQSNTQHTDRGATAAASPASVCHPAPKWMALVDDVPLPMPRRIVTGYIIRSQASLCCDFVLTRDHNSPNDPVIHDEDTVDLAEGNVFNRLAILDEKPRAHCLDEPKLAFFIDDRPELSINPAQTGRSLRELFGLAPDVRLYRDFESPQDENVAAAAPARHADGPVFYTRRQQIHAGLAITVNARPFTEADGVKAEMRGEAIARLVYPQAPRSTRVFQRDDGRDREIGLDEVVQINGCEVFDVARCKVDGGHGLTRVEREVALLTGAGSQVSLISSSAAAVIYRALRTRPGYAVESTDVLVPVPTGYPGQFLDWAYLPEGSPLIGRVVGSPQNHLIQADGRAWRQISYHPHNGGGGPLWDQTIHGFHTYVTELIAWLYNAR